MIIVALINFVGLLTLASYYFLVQQVTQFILANNYNPLGKNCIGTMHFNCTVLCKSKQGFQFFKLASFNQAWGLYEKFLTKVVNIFQMQWINCNKVNMMTIPKLWVELTTEHFVIPTTYRYINLKPKNQLQRTISYSLELPQTAFQSKFPLNKYR